MATSTRLLELIPTSAVASSTPEDARRTVAAAERAANGSSARRPAAGTPRRLANGAHRVEARSAGTEKRPRPIRPDTPPSLPATGAEPGVELATGHAGQETDPTEGDRTANGFRRRQPKAAAPEHEGRGPSRLRAPDPTSAEERRDRLQRFSAGKATAEEVLSLRDTSGDAGGGVDPSKADASKLNASRSDGNGTRTNGVRGDSDGGAVGGEAG